MILRRTSLSPSYIDDFLRDPLVATVKWNLGWRPKEDGASVARMAFGRLREWAEVLLRNEPIVGWVVSRVTGSEDYKLLCDNAPPTRFAMQPTALLDAVVAYGRTAPDRFRGETIERVQPREETPLLGTGRVLVCKGDLWTRHRDGTLTWDECKATSSGRGVEMTDAYRQSVQGRLYALTADRNDMPVRYLVWDVGSDRTAFRTFTFREPKALLDETLDGLYRFGEQLGFWEEQATSWLPSWAEGGPCRAPVLPSPGRRGHWRNLFALPAGPARAAYLADNFEYNPPRDGKVIYGQN